MSAIFHTSFAAFEKAFESNHFQDGWPASANEVREQIQKHVPAIFQLGLVPGHIAWDADGGVIEFRSKDEKTGVHFVFEAKHSFTEFPDSRPSFTMTVNKDGQNFPYNKKEVKPLSVLTSVGFGLSRFITDTIGA